MELVRALRGRAPISRCIHPSAMPQAPHLSLETSLHCRLCLAASALTTNHHPSLAHLVPPPAPSPAHSTALAVERDLISHIPHLLAEMPPGDEERMRSMAVPMVERMLYTTFEFSSLPTRGVPCVGCARSLTTDWRRIECNADVVAERAAKFGGKVWRGKMEAVALNLNINTSKEPCECHVATVANSKPPLALRNLQSSFSGLSHSADYEGGGQHC